MISAFVDKSLHFCNSVFSETKTCYRTIYVMSKIFFFSVYVLFLISQNVYSDYLWVVELWLFLVYSFGLYFFPPVFYSAHVFIMQWISLWRQKTIETESPPPSKVFVLIQFSAGITLVFALLAGSLLGLCCGEISFSTIKEHPFWAAVNKFSVILCIFI